MTTKQGANATVRVRFNECDPTGFAFNGNYFTWMQEATSEYFRQADVDLRKLAYSSQTFMAVHLSCDYKRPIAYEDVIEIRSCIDKLGESSLALQYEIFKGEELMAVGKSIHVFLNIKTKEKASIPEDIRKKLEHVTGER